MEANNKQVHVDSMAEEIVARVCWDRRGQGLGHGVHAGAASEPAGQAHDRGVKCVGENQLDHRACRPAG